MIVSQGVPGGATNVEMGKDPPRFRPGGADWSEVPRPRRQAISEFAGQKLAGLILPLMPDQYPDGDVEPTIQLLEAWMTAPGGAAEPPPLQIIGPVPHPEIQWVLTDIDDSGLVERRSDGRRCRQELSLSFLQYLASDFVVQTPPPAQAAQQRAETGAAPSEQRTYTVKKGDTLWAISARELGNGNKWQSIASLNDVRDPRKLKIGQVLRLP